MSEKRQIGNMNHVIKYLSTLFAYQKLLAGVPYLMSEIEIIGSKEQDYLLKTMALIEYLNRLRIPTV